MPSVFSGSVPFYAKDRDGYEELAHTTSVSLTFLRDGRLEAREEGSSEPTLTGTWSASEGSALVSFTLERRATPEPEALEVPGDGSNYYAYPASACNAALAEGACAGPAAAAVLLLAGATALLGLLAGA